MREIPTGWRQDTLNAVVELQRGFDLPTQARRPGRHPVLTAGGGGGWHDLGPVRGPGFVVGRATNVGKPKWSDIDFWPHNTTMFAKDFKGNAPRWLFHLFEAMDLSGFDSGSVQPMLNRNYIAQVPVLVPPLAEQHAIAEVLGALDAKVSTNSALAASADSYLATVFDKLTQTAPEVHLSKVADVNPLSVKPRLDGHLRYIDIASVGVGSFEFPERMPWVDAPGRARRRVTSGDTLWSTVRPNRRSHALVLDDDPELIASSALAVLAPRIVGFAYLYEATKRVPFSAYLENVAEGSAYPAVRAEHFLEAPIPYTDQATCTAFEDVAAPLRQLVANLGRESRTLTATRDALLPQLMSGKLRVRDAEEMASAAGV